MPYINYTCQLPNGVQFVFPLDWDDAITVAYAEMALNIIERSYYDI